MGANPQWEDVLAAVEADVARTEEMFRPATDPVRPLAPADFQLPAGYLDLPRLEDMPDVPDELFARIRDLQLRITSLQLQLTAELADLRAVRSGPLSRAGRAPVLASAAQAQFLDCTA